MSALPSAARKVRSVGAAPMTLARVRRAVVPAIFISICVPSVTGAVLQVIKAAGDPGIHHAAVAGYQVLRAVVAVAFAIFVLLRGPARTPSRDPRAFAWCTVAMGAIVVIGAPGASASTAAVIGGEALALLGAIWLVVSVVTLGRCFSVLPEARGLVTTGPYRLVRHPVYLGELTIAAGMVLASPAVPSVVAGCLAAVAQGRRIAMEEAALTAAFPEYAEYARRTSRFLPKPRVT
jgi:protein-S-isoprenylcysteine O-methyltransferase Ste14